MKKNLTPAILVVALLMFIGAGALFVSESRAESKTYKIGDRGPVGGWIFYDKGDFSDGWRYLEAAPEDQAVKAAWGCYGKSIPDAKGTAIGTGKANTAAILKSCGQSGIAAKLCTAYRGGGKGDWFLPSKDELNLMYENLHLKGAGGFAVDDYWSSSEDDVDYAWDQFFLAGNQYFNLKNFTNRVRAIRAF